MNLKEASHHILDQIYSLVQELSADDFTEKIPVLNHSTIGQHVRHTVEFFDCLISGSCETKVNYDNRTHDKSIECNSSLAMIKIMETKSGIDTLEENQVLKLEVNYSQEEVYNNIVPTSVARELAYNIEHAVHHMAIIKIGVKSIRPDIELPRDFGVAVSTIRYHESRQVQA